MHPVREGIHIRLIVMLTLYPLAPFEPIPIHQSIRFKLRTFGVHNVARFAAGIGYLLLLVQIEMIKPRGERISQVLYVTAGVQGAPWVRASCAFARLENEEQRV
jgi:hypothetical protein